MIRVKSILVGSLCLRTHAHSHTHILAHTVSHTQHTHTYIHTHTHAHMRSHTWSPSSPPHRQQRFFVHFLLLDLPLLLFLLLIQAPLLILTTVCVRGWCGSRAWKQRTNNLGAQWGNCCVQMCEYGINKMLIADLVASM